MHDEIKRYSLAGTIADDDIIKRKERLVNDLESAMRDEGFVPVLDLDPQFTLQFLPDSETYEFKLSVYGCEVDNPWAVAGMMSGVPISKSTSLGKSRP